MAPQERRDVAKFTRPRHAIGKHRYQVVERATQDAPLFMEQLHLDYAPKTTVALWIEGNPCPCDARGRVGGASVMS